jgi:hypothetical protein
LSGAGAERTAADVHATLCALVTTEAAQHSAWAEYAAVLLDEETASFFAARLTEGKGVTDGEESKPPSKKNKKQKKRKLQADSEEGKSAAASDADPISLRVACLDGSSLDLKVPPRELVREVKRAIGQVRRRRLAIASASSFTPTVSCTPPLWCLSTTRPPARSRHVDVCLGARHGPGLDRALRRRQGGRPA